MLIDTRKLDEVRDVVDEAITEIAIRSNVDLPTARDMLATQLGFTMERTVQGTWCIACAVSQSEMRRSARIYLHKGVSLASVYEGRMRASRSFAALSLADAETAVLCRILDEHLDLSNTAVVQERHSESACAPDEDGIWCDYSEYMWTEFDTQVGAAELRAKYN